MTEQETIDRILARTPLNSFDLMVKVAAMFADAGFQSEALEVLEGLLEPNRKD
ncbi:MAG: hypothetical protein HC875_20680 [Anaerolineales bacterium]|nr:hypothetical protein [Anaerolineales bacterium]